MASRSGNRRRELSRQCEAVEKQEIRRRASEHTYRDKEREERDVSAGNRDDVRRAREELMSIEQSRLRLPERVMRGEAEALEEDQHLETRLRELAHWLMSAEQQDEEGSGTSWEGRGRRWG
ncbi:MAG TPA: hypothetical protein VI027_08275 [Rubrobacteraceae bacterium]